MRQQLERARHVGLGTQFFKVMNQGHVWLYRATKGRLGTMGGTVVLLTARGARSGRPRTTPLTGIAHEGGWLLAASAGGAPRNPAWYHNIVANPDVTLEKGADVLHMTARVAGPDERPALWARFVESNKSFAKYEAKTEREIPVVVLEPRSGSRQTA